MINNLFSSQILFDVMQYLFQKKDLSATISEIVENTDNNQVNVLRSLEKLTDWDFVQKTKRGNLSIYTLSKNNPYHSTLRDLFQLHRTYGKKYFKVNEEDGVSLLGWSYFIAGFTSQKAVSYKILPEVKTSFAFIKHGYGEYYMEKESFLKNARISLEKLTKNAQFVQQVIFPQTLAQGEKAMKLFRTLEKNLDTISPKKATQHLDQFADIITEQIALGHIAVFDLVDQPYSNYLKNYIDKKTKKTSLRSNIVIEKLLTPEHLSFTQYMRLDLLRLAQKELADGKQDTQTLKHIWNSWKWLNYGYRGPVFPLSYFENMLQEMKEKSPAELVKAQKKLENHPSTTKDIKEQLYTDLSIDAKHRKFIDALSLLSYLKVYRKDIAFLLIYLTYEILTRFNTTLKPKNLHLINLTEAKKLILGQLNQTEKDIAQREQGVILYDAGERILSGENAEKFLTDHVLLEETKDHGALSRLEGVTASLGDTGNWIYGTARIINTPKDMEKMKEGDILISVGTTPDILPAMKKAAAIVTNQGGITCHAAIVSRELNIPCLIATKYATKIFQDGDKIVMCPRHGYVKFQ